MLAWYLVKNGKKFGPYSDSVFRALVVSGKVTEEDTVWRTGFSAWQKASEVEGLFSPPKLNRQDEKSSVETTEFQPSDEDALKKQAKHTYPATSDFQSPSSSDKKPSIISQKKSNFFVRHLRGELSLGVSYWVNGVLVSNVCGAGLVLLGLFGANFTNPTVIWFLIVGVWLAAWFIAMWASIGIWRSANNHIASTKRVFWASVAKLMIALGLLSLVAQTIQNALPQIREITQIAFGTDPLGDYSVEIINEGDELLISGVMIYGIAGDVKQILVRNPSIHVINLSSTGGRIAPAKQLADLIKNGEYITYTQDLCLSACTMVFAAGKERIIHPAAKLGFHAPSSIGGSVVDTQGLKEEYRQALLENGIDSAFVNRAVSTPNETMWYPTTDELISANVITLVLKRKPIPLAKTTLNRKKLDKGLQELQLFKKFKELEPEVYENALDKVEQRMAEGQPLEEAIAVIRTILSKQIYPKYLPFASDETVVGMTELMLQQIDFFESVEPGGCYGVLVPSSAKSSNLLSQMPDNLKNSEIELGAQVLETADMQRYSSSEPDNLEAIFSDVLTQLELRYGEDVTLLSDLGTKEATTPKDKAKTCEIVKAFYTLVLKLPDKTKVKTLRSIYSQM